MSPVGAASAAHVGLKPDLQRELQREAGRGRRPLHNQQKAATGLPPQQRLSLLFFVLTNSRFDHRFQFAALVQFQRDIAATDQLAAHVNLREGRPIGVAWQILEYFRIFQHIDIAELDATRGNGLGRTRGKSAHRELWRALHVNHDGGGFNLFANAI